MYFESFTKVVMSKTVKFGIPDLVYNIIYFYCHTNLHTISLSLFFFKRTPNVLTLQRANSFSIAVRKISQSIADEKQACSHAVIYLEFILYL